MLKLGYNVKFCSTPQINTTSHSEKCQWIYGLFGPDMAKNLILTHDKTLIKGDILIDDKINIKGLCKPEWTHVLFRSIANINYNSEYILESWYHDWNKIFNHILK